VLNFPGMTSGASPPDTNMDVGPNHVVQMVNGAVTSFEVWDKQGNDLSGGPLDFGGLWPGGNICNSEAGDPIVVYDHLADRWLLSQFAGSGANSAMCIAISQTPTPLPANGFFLYSIPLTVFPDYPKFGVWPDAYYMSSYESPNLGAFAFERERMLNGQAAGFVKFTISALSGSRRDTRMLPSDLDGPAPPDGTPNFFFHSVDDLQDSSNPTDRLEIYSFKVDWTNPVASSFTLANTIDGTSTPPLAPFNTMACNRNGQGIRDCIPQADTADTLDALSNRPMMQLKFRTMSSSDFRIVVNQTIDVSGSIPAMLGITVTKEVAGVRWYELQNTSGNWVIRQQGTFAAQPLNATTEGDLLHRWMGSAAIDRFGNIALGYSIVNNADNDGVLNNAGEVYPGIRYTGRRFDDPLNLLQQGENIILNGTTPQVFNDATDNPQRWGDYSAMTVDPVDDCTFWYTTQVANGVTRIGSFRFDNCGTDLAITKTASPSPATAGGQLTYTISVSNNGPLDATNVRVIDTLPAGASFVTNTDSCVEAPVGTLTCSLGTLVSGTSKSFDIQVQLSSSLASSGSTSITNTASVQADQADPNPSNNQTSVTTIVGASADISVSKVCKPDGPAPAGSTAFCNIIVSNAGPSDAQNVMVSDLLSSTITPTITLGSGSCVISSNPIVCNVGTLPRGGSALITINVTSNNPGDVNDTAMVSSSTPDPNPSNNSATGHISFSAVADLSIAKVASANSASCPFCAGTNLTYTIAATNAGPSTATGVVIKDTIPAQVAVVSVTPSVGSCTAGIPGNPLQPLTCTVGNLAASATATVTVVATVSSNVANGTVINNNASVSSGVADPNNANNSATAAVTVIARGDLAIAKTSDQSVYKPSSIITYTVAVTNNGPSDSLAVVVTDNLPTTMQALYQSDTGGCTKSGLTLTCNLGNMPVGTSKSFLIRELVKGSRGLVSNTATVTSATTDPNSANNSSTRVVTIGH
jgi:uncharacterized repeat protein (TIGR01451 family)